MPMTDLGKALVGLGLLLVLIGGVVLLAARIGFPLGRLPGDIAYKNKNIQLYIPLGTSILVSLILSLFFYVIGRFRH